MPPAVRHALVLPRPVQVEAFTGFSYAPRPEGIVQTAGPIAPSIVKSALACRVPALQQSHCNTACSGLSFTRVITGLNFFFFIIYSPPFYYCEPCSKLFSRRRISFLTFEFTSTFTVDKISQINEPNFL